MDGFDSPDRSADSHPESVLKIVILGEPGVGKSSLIQRFLQDRFSCDSIQTSGVEFHRKRLSFPGHIDVSLHIWDTGGSGTLTSPMLGSYLHEAQVLIFMYDITNNASFTKLSDWFTASNQTLTEQTNFTESSDKFMIGKDGPFLALVGNKSDMQHIRAVKQEKIKEFAEKAGIAEIAMVSAQSGDGVQTLFRKITATVLGLRLGRADFEQDIVAAEIPHEQKDAHPVPKPHMTRTRSVVCSIN